MTNLTMRWGIERFLRDVKIELVYQKRGNLPLTVERKTKLRLGVITNEALKNLDKENFHTRYENLSDQTYPYLSQVCNLLAEIVMEDWWYSRDFSLMPYGVLRGVTCLVTSTTSGSAILAMNIE